MRTFKFILPLIGAALLLNSCSKDESVLSDEEQSEQAPVNLSARSSAKQLYEDFYVASATKSADPSWSNNGEDCSSGAIPEVTKDKIFMRLSYFRKAVGLHNTVSENATKSNKAQDAALMMKSNGTLDHFPPESWSCYSESGKEGAANSLLTQAKNAAAVDSYIQDQGSANGPVGHRRWLLWPRLQEIGVGNTDATNAIWVLGNAGDIPSDNPEFISWPPEGYTPKQLAYPRWSFSIKDADFTNTTIKMQTENGQAISLALEELDFQFGDNTIVWVPSINQSAVAADTAYKVTISDVNLNNETQEFEYTVILFNPKLE